MQEKVEDMTALSQHICISQWKVTFEIELLMCIITYFSKYMWKADCCEIYWRAGVLDAAQSILVGEMS